MTLPMKRMRRPSSLELFCRVNTIDCRPVECLEQESVKKTTLFGCRWNFIFCRLCPFSPKPPLQCFSVWLLSPVISLALTDSVTPVRACLSIWWERFLGPKKKTIMGFLVFNPLWYGLFVYHTVRKNTKREEREVVIIAMLARGRGGGSIPGTAKRCYS